MTHPVIAGLASADPEARRRACEAAADDPSAVVLVDALCVALGDPVPPVSRAASDALARIGLDDAGPALRRAIHGDDPLRRVSAALTELRMGPPSLRHLPVLVEALALPSGQRRWTAARHLVGAGRLHGEVLPLLLGLAAGDASPRVRRMAVFCLRDLAPDRPETSAALVAASRDGELHVRRGALTAMAGLLGSPRNALARLLEAVAGEADGASRRIAALSLGSLAGDPPDAEVVDALRRARDHAEDPDLRRAARTGLARAGYG